MDKEKIYNWVETEVKNSLSRLIGKPTTDIDNSDELALDLHMNSIQIRSLHIPFTKIVKKINPAAVIVPDECEEQETVQDCIDLINNKL